MSENLAKKGWAVLWAAIGINFFCGLGYIWSIIGKVLMKDLGWTSFQSTLPYTVFTILFALAMPLAGPIQDKKGPKFVATLGGVLIGGGLILTGLILNPVSMPITFGAAGFGIGSMYAATVPPAMKWFPPSKKGMINGIVVAMVAIASVMYSPVTKMLMHNIGVQQTFLAIGGFNLVFLLIAAQFLSNPPEGYVADPNAEKVEVKKTHHEDVETKAMLKTPNFYKMWFMFALGTSAGLMIIGQAANIAKIQASWEGGFILVIILSVFNALGRTFGGIVSDKIGRPNTIRLTFIILAVNMLLFAHYTNFVILIIGVAIVGASYGSCMVTFSASTADLYGMKYFGANYGLVYTAWGIAGVVGPLPSSFIFDATQSFNGAYLLSAGMVVVALIISFTFKIKTIEHAGDVPTEEIV